MNLTPVPLEIRGGVPVLNFEFTDLPIREFDLPTPSPVCAASHSPPQNKVQAVIDFPRPQNQKDLKSFLGLSGFYRPFIKDYGSIAQPLTTLLKKDVPFEWAKETEDSFLQLKALLANAPVLAFPDFELPFVLTTDASSVGLGATLHQKVNGKLRPIAFASRTLKPAERSYHTTDRELLAITYALRHFRELILGYKIEVHTDHSALTTALHGRDPHGRRARAIEVLAEYDVTIVYLPGRQNVVADALSRAPLPSPAELQACKSTPFPPSFAKRHEARTTAPVLANVANQPVDPPSEEEIRRAQREDPVYMDIIGKLERGEPLVPVRRLPVRQFYLADSGLLFRRATPKKIKGRRGLVRDVVVIPESLEPRVLQLVHESREAAHCGVYKAIQMARQRFFFPLHHKASKGTVSESLISPQDIDLILKQAASHKLHPLFTLTDRVPFYSTLKSFLTISGHTITTPPPTFMTACTQALPRLFVCNSRPLPLFSDDCSDAIITNHNIINECSFDSIVPTSRPFHLPFDDISVLYFFQPSTATVTCKEALPDVVVTGIYVLPISCEIVTTSLFIPASHSYATDIRPWSQHQPHGTAAQDFAQHTTTAIPARSQGQASPSTLTRQPLDDI
ncbi:hypothetical protein C7M84_024113 [Penaeus vannamei]|uniref:RNA-directed DNA polymerase n=1 Tax=Penaeus vannamei TaxID=6689 RepID=A0A3R7SZ95_PENVA|nr:hypothetical protein C7M84_024113 [Penaeus vannamei]